MFTVHWFALNCALLIMMEHIYVYSGQYGYRCGADNRCPSKERHYVDTGGMRYETSKKSINNWQTKFPILVAGLTANELCIKDETSFTLSQIMNQDFMMDYTCEFSSITAKFKDNVDNMDTKELRTRHKKWTKVVAIFIMA